MNLVYEHPCTPLKVVLVNPTNEVLVMISLKVLRGVLFGQYQLIDLILLVYANDIPKAQELKWNLEAGAFPCNNSITITSDLPRITDADLFIFISNFKDPNCFDPKMVDDDDYFDSLYLFLKIANNFEMPEPRDEQEEEENSFFKKFTTPINKPRRPIILTDGLVALDIMKTFSKNLPNDIFFCPCSTSAISKSILGDQMKVECTDLNNLYVWAANDRVFHVDIKSPMYLPEKKKKRRRCEWEMLSDVDYEALNMDTTQINAGWLKKDFITKIYSIISNHNHGSIYKAAKVTKALQNIWRTRSLNPEPEYLCNIGIISDGSLGTYKGLPYVLPVEFREDTFTVNEHLKEDIYLKQELKRINKAVLESHKLLKLYCKHFLEKNVIRQEFVHLGESSNIETDMEITTGTSSSGLID